MKALSLLLVFAGTAAVRAAELKPETIAAFQHYVKLTESRLDADFLRTGRLLRLDRLPDDQRRQAYDQLRKGEMVIQPLETREGSGAEISVPSGLVHHWVGVEFIPGTTLQKTMALLMDYDHHDVTYRPFVIKSKLLEHHGNEYRVFLRLYKKKVVTVILNNTHLVRYEPIDARRMKSRAESVRIAEVEDSANPEGPEKPVGNDHGYLWRLTSFWRFEERDGGVYMEVESVTLTRDIPTGVGWLVGPIVKSLPREAVMHTLDSTRAALRR
jgi:hypothetical protein